jgi:peptide/nickel transport system ATP-binding protein
MLNNQILLDVRDLHVEFNTRGGKIYAVNGVSFTLKEGEILGIVGESGSGKSVTGLSIMGLNKSHTGSIHFEGRDLLKLTPKQWREIRGKEIAMIFQDPIMTLNPVLSVETQMVEAVLAHANVTKAEALARCIAVLEQVGIANANQRIKAYPHQFSGGMRQRVAIAIALLHKPKLMIADEPTTALDVTIQSQILVEMQKLVRENNTALIWVSHDLGLVSSLADKIAVIYGGAIVEMGETSAVLTSPRHPYTIGLLRSLPSQNKRGEPLFQIEGNTPRLLESPRSCPFAPRCFKVHDICWQEKPHFIDGVACHD